MWKIGVGKAARIKWGQLARRKIGMPFWFGVTLTLSCPTCQRPSIVQAAFVSESDDELAATACITGGGLRLYCPRCGEAIEKAKVRVHGNIQRGSPAELEAQGFPIPVRYLMTV